MAIAIHYHLYRYYCGIYDWKVRRETKRFNSYNMSSYFERGNMLCGDCVAAFIRSIVGVDRSVAVQKFSDFLSDSTLNSE